jgi:hypothetical protein
MAAFHYFSSVELVSPQDVLGGNEQPISNNVKTLKVRQLRWEDYVFMN